MILKKFFKLIRKSKKKSKIKNKAVVEIDKKKKIAKKTIKVKTKESVVKKKEELIGEAVHYFSKIKVAVLKLRKPVRINEEIRLKGFTTDFKQIVSSMQIDHISVEIAKKGQEVGIKVKGKVRHGDKVYKI